MKAMSLVMSLGLIFATLPAFAAVDCATEVLNALKQDVNFDSNYRFGKVDIGRYGSRMVHYSVYYRADAPKEKFIALVDLRPGTCVVSQIGNVSAE